MLCVAPNLDMETIMRRTIGVIALLSTAIATSAWGQNAQPNSAPAQAEHSDQIVAMRMQTAAANKTYNMKVAAAKKVFDQRKAEAAKERDAAIAVARNGATAQ